MNRPHETGAKAQAVVYIFNLAPGVYQEEQWNIRKGLFKALAILNSIANPGGRRMPLGQF